MSEGELWADFAGQEVGTGFRIQVSRNCINYTVRQK